MIRLFKITTWIVISLSIIFMLFLLFIFIIVDLVMGNPHSFYDTGLPLLYWMALPAFLIMTQIEKYKNKFSVILAAILLLIGIIFGIYGIYDNYMKGFWQTHYLISFAPLTLLLITFVGLLNNRKTAS